MKKRILVFLVVCVALLSSVACQSGRNTSSSIEINTQLSISNSKEQFSSGEQSSEISFNTNLNTSSNSAQTSSSSMPLDSFETTLLPM